MNGSGSAFRDTHSLNDNRAGHIRVDLAVVRIPACRCECEVEPAARRDIARGPLVPIRRRRVRRIVAVEPADRRSRGDQEWIRSKRRCRLRGRAARNGHHRATSRCSSWRHRGARRRVVPGTRGNADCCHQNHNEAERHDRSILLPTSGAKTLPPMDGEILR